MHVQMHYYSLDIKKGGKGLTPTDHTSNDNYMHVLSMLF